LDLPVAEDVAARGISLPSYPALSDEEVVRVASAMKKAIRQQSADGEHRAAGEGR